MLINFGKGCWWGGGRGLNTGRHGQVTAPRQKTPGARQKTPGAKSRVFSHGSQRLGDNGD